MMTLFQHQKHTQWQPSVVFILCVFLQDGQPSPPALGPEADDIHPPLWTIAAVLFAGGQGRRGGRWDHLHLPHRGGLGPQAETPEGTHKLK